MARKHKNASKRYKGATMVDPELNNILQKRAKEEEHRREVMHVGDDLHSVQRALAEEKRKQAEILGGEEDWQALRHKLKEQKRQRNEWEHIRGEAVRLSAIFTACDTVLALIVMSLILLWTGR